MPSRRLEDRIRELCSIVVTAREAELEPAFSELKSALQEHTLRLRQMVADNLAKAQPIEKRRRLSQSPFPICSICRYPVDLTISKTDESGESVHEDCYVLKLRASWC